MVVSSSSLGVVFKSPLRVVVRVLQRSRDLAKRKLQELGSRFDDLRGEVKRLEQERTSLQAKLDAAEAEVRRLQLDLRTARSQPAVLPPDPPLGTHGYGVRMVELSLRLAQAVGFRPATKVMKVVFDWLKVDQQVPHFTAIRNWMQRSGVAAMSAPLEKASDWIWIVDHSNQIGQDKILVILGIRASHLPPPGTALRLEHVRVLLVQPGKSWKRKNVARAYKKLAKVHGAPRVVLSDGAVELRDSVEVLKKLRQNCISLQDFKHKAANFLEAELGKTPRFSEFTAHVGRTRAAIQQTELAHLTPPGLKTKARFMNLGTLLNWGETVLWQLDHPEAKTRRGLSADRLDTKLGWLRSFRTDLAGWKECQQVIQRGLKFINTQGVSVGASDKLHAILMADLQYDQSRNLANRLTDFVKAAEAQLTAGERIPLSTEILESSFARYKQLEGQHAKGGFTSLVAAFAGLLQDPTPETIRENFARCSNKDLKQWLKKNLEQTVASKRVAVYREMKRATQPQKARAEQRVTLLTAMA